MTIKQITEESKLKAGRLWQAIVTALPENEARELVALNRAGKMTSDTISTLLQKAEVREKVLDAVKKWSIAEVGGENE